MVEFGNGRKNQHTENPFLINTEKEIEKAEENLKLLRDGIPLKDENGNLVGWMEKPDRAANEFFLKKKAAHKGYGKLEIENTSKKWHEI